MENLNSKGPLLAGVLAAIGASVCCVGPLVLLALGIGGAWVSNLTALEPYRPIFIGVALLAFGLAYRRLYQVRAACAPGAACATPVIAQRQRIIFWGVVVLALCLLLVPTVAPLFL
ncbi:mercuric transporter MerT family protein [Noviherbaspirillum sp. 1P10PC]|uniref:mercuric transporter MerT family protein n=1 Tax=Noviherbaspirillum sp. 1P10PC TaxID=3132292 RepID=UPI0039A1D0FF